MKQKLTVYQVDAFTHELFKGNPAGVCLYEKALDVTLMQNIALEMNLSETAFVRKMGSNFEIRYFTPEVEVDLCGHSTLSSAHIIFETGIVPKNKTISFKAKASDLSVKIENGWIVMNFPQYFLKKIEGINAFKEITGISPLEIYECDRGWKIILVDNEEDIAKMNPNSELLKQNNLGHIMVTAKSKKNGIDYVDRCFVPDVGIIEDPVTGSAQCGLGPYWKMKTGKTHFVCQQLSKRGGILKIDVLDERIDIAGQAITVFKTEFSI